MKREIEPHKDPEVFGLTDPKDTIAYTRLELSVKFLAALPQTGFVDHYSVEQREVLEHLLSDFGVKQLWEIKGLQKQDNETEGVEGYLQDKLSGFGFEQAFEVGNSILANEARNDLSRNIYLNRLKNGLLVPADNLVDALSEKSRKWCDVEVKDMATGVALPATLGEELADYALRLARQRQKISQTDFTAYLSKEMLPNLHKIEVVDSRVDWMLFLQGFIKNFTRSSLGSEVVLDKKTPIKSSYDLWPGMLGRIIECNTTVRGLTRYLLDEDPTNIEVGQANTLNERLSAFAEDLQNPSFRCLLSDSTVENNLGVTLKETTNFWGNVRSLLSENSLPPNNRMEYTVFPDGSKGNLGKIREVKTKIDRLMFT